MKRLLAVFAHPDDEAFGPGGTLALYARKGVDIHLLCATRGESGQLHENISAKGRSSSGRKNNEDIKIHHIREKELLKSAKTLGIHKVEFLDFIDGQLCNTIYHELAQKVIRKISSFKPQVVVTYDRLGVSGHIDHMALSMMTTYAFRQSTVSNKLYYYCLTKRRREPAADKYFIYFPEGYDEEAVTTRIDYTPLWDVKRSAMYQHQSQTHDVERIVRWITPRPKIDHFILQMHRNIRVQLPETDLFAGI